MSDEEFYFHEKTLELNITNELLNLANGIVPRWDPPYPDRFYFWYYFWEFQPRVEKPAIAYGLHTNVEGSPSLSGKRGGGFDAGILGQDDQFFVFIQYKGGKKVGDASPDRIRFKLSTKRMVGDKDGDEEVKQSQFQLFWNLYRISDDMKSNDIPDANNTNPAFYAFPSFYSIPEVKANAGKLVHRTRFVSIKEIRDDAEELDSNGNKKVDLFDHHEHHYSFDYATLKNPKIESDETDARDGDGQFGLFGDIVMIRIWRWFRNSSSRPLRTNEKWEKKFLFTLMACTVLGIEPSNSFVRWAKENKGVANYSNPIFNYFYDFYDDESPAPAEENTWEHRIALYIEKRISDFVEQLLGTGILGTDIPVPILLAFRQITESAKITLPKNLSFDEFSSLQCLVI